jgi:hypothetical protein
VPAEATSFGWADGARHRRDPGPQSWQAFIGGTVEIVSPSGKPTQGCGPAGWTERFPGLFETRDGKLATARLTGPGLGAVA